MTERKSFGSDNHAGVHPAVLRAIVDSNQGDAVAYGADTWTEQATAGLREIFGADDAFLVLNGSGANILGLSVLLRRHEAVICAESAHINTDECGSSERLHRHQAAAGAEPGREDHPGAHRGKAVGTR